MGEEIERSMASKSAEDRKQPASKSLPPSGPTMGMDDVRRVVESPLQSFLPAVLKAEVPILSQMVMTIYCSPKPAFITSDNPVVWYDSESHKRPLMFQGAALMYDTIEITMPLSPRHMIAMHHDQPMSRGIKPVRYVDVWRSNVDARNRGTTLYADKAVVAWNESFDPAWRIRQ